MSSENNNNFNENNTRRIYTASYSEHNCFSPKYNIGFFKYDSGKQVNGHHSNSSPFPSRPWMSNFGAAAASDKNMWLKGIIAGGVAGGVEISITYPTEYVKTLLQLAEKSSKGGGSKQYEGIVDCVKKTVQQHGFFGLYRGLPVLLTGSIPKVAVRFGAYETIKSFFVSEKKPTLSPHESTLCGLLAGAIEALLIVTPMETIKVKFINDRTSANPRYKGYIHGLKTMIREEGFKGIYQGPVPTMVRQGSNQAIRFLVLETLKNFYAEKEPGKKVPKYLISIFGFLSAGIAVLGNAPIDVVKTRMQGLEASKYKSSLDCFLKMVRYEGVSALYKGTLPRLLRICLDGAITFTAYEYMLDLLNYFWP